MSPKGGLVNYDTIGLHSWTAKIMTTLGVEKVDFHHFLKEELDRETSEPLLKSRQRYVRIMPESGNFNHYNRVYDVGALMREEYEQALNTNDEALKKKIQKQIQKAMAQEARAILQEEGRGEL